VPYKDPLAAKTYKRLWDERNRDKRLAYDRHRRARTKELITSLRAEIQRLRARRRRQSRREPDDQRVRLLATARGRFLTRTLDKK